MDGTVEIPIAALEYMKILTLRSTNVITKSSCLHKLWTLLDNDDYKILLGKDTIGLIDLLVNIVLTNTDGVSCIRNALGCLWYLSRATENKFSLANPSLGLIPILVQNLLNENEYEEYSFNILINCSLEPRTHAYLLREEIGYLDFCTRKIQTANETDPYVAVANIVSCIERENLYHIIRLRIHELIINKLFSFNTSVENWNGRSGGIVYWCLNFLIDFTRYHEAMEIFDQQMPWLVSSPFFYRLLNCEAVEGLKALCILSHLSETWESYSNNLPTVASKFPRLVELINWGICVTLDCDRGEYAELMDGLGFVFGIISMKVLTNVIKLLCRASNENCYRFIENSLFYKNMIRIIQLYIENAPELVAKFDCVETAGGGGKDEDSLCNALEILYLCIIASNGITSMEAGVTLGTTPLVAKKVNELLSLSSAGASDRKLPEKARILCHLILPFLQ